MTTLTRKTAGGTQAFAQRRRRPPVAVSPLLTATDVGLPSLYWTRPFPNPATTGPSDRYVWLGSLDHGSSSPTHYRGYSASPSVAPTSWTTFGPTGSGSQKETPHFVYDPDEVRPFRLYFHSAENDGVGGMQATRLASYTTAWGTGTSHGRVLLSTENTGPTVLDHTGYAFVLRNSATDWEAWSLTRGGADSTNGYWTSADGEVWDCVDDDIGFRPSLVFTVGNSGRYGIGTVSPPGYSGAGAFPDTKTVVYPMPTPTTQGTPTVIWDPHDFAVVDNMRDVRAMQDPDDEMLIHLYPHIDSTAVYYATHTVTP